jgi:hypothetical protein
MNLQEQLEDLSKKYNESVRLKKTNCVKVYSRCVFERIIDIDTKNERYDADVIFESSWLNDEILNVLLSPNIASAYSKYLFECLKFRTVLKTFNIR